MSILRDVLARFAVEVEDQKLTKFDKGIDQLKSKIASVAKVSAVAFGAAGYGLLQLVEAASAADEAMNRLQRTFGKKETGGVLEWSENFAKEVGRSKYDVQNTLAEFGAFLAPKFDDATTATMSEMLTTLTTDLASFYDTSDAEAKMRLFSGMAGETEAVRRLGIDLSDEALRAMNEKKGKTDKRFGGKYDALGQDEKTILRLEKIIEDTKDKAGDATLTALSWQNSLKRVQGKWHELRVDIGRIVKSYALPLLYATERWLKVLDQILRRLAITSSTFQALLVLSTGILAAWTATVAVQALGALSLIKLVAYASEYAFLIAKAGAAMLAFLVIEDIITFFRGGRSMIGEFVKSLSGLSDPLHLVKGWFDDVALTITGAANRLERAGFRLAALGRYLTDIGNPDRKKNFDEALAFGNQNYKDTDQLRAEQEAKRSEAWDAGVTSGKPAYGQRRPGESQTEAYERYKSERKTLINQGTVEPTNLDSTLGLSNRYVAPVQNISSSVVPKSVKGRKTVVNHNTVNLNGHGLSKEEAEEVTVNVLERMVRQGEAEDGEEMPEESDE